MWDISQNNRLIEFLPAIIWPFIHAQVNKIVKWIIQNKLLPFQEFNKEKMQCTDLKQKVTVRSLDSQGIHNVYMYIFKEENSDLMFQIVTQNNNCIFK